MRRDNNLVGVLRYHAPHEQIALVIVVLVACSKDKERSTTRDPGAGAAAEQEGDDGAALGKKPAAPFGKIEKLKLGMSEADAKAAVPQLFTGKPLLDEDNALSFTPVIEQGKLRRLEVKSTSLDSFAPLATAWALRQLCKRCLLIRVDCFAGSAASTCASCTGVTRRITS